MNNYTKPWANTPALMIKYKIDTDWTPTNKQEEEAKKIVSDLKQLQFDRIISLEDTLATIKELRNGKIIIATINPSGVISYKTIFDSKSKSNFEKNKEKIIGLWNREKLLNYSPGAKKNIHLIFRKMYRF